MGFIRKKTSSAVNKFTAALEIAGKRRIVWDKLKKESFMKREIIEFASFNTQIFNLWAKDWLLLSAGSFPEKKYNMMTVGWGSIGVIWRKPFVMALVRPQRYTINFMENFDSFTLTAFPQEKRNILDFCGSKSGRDFPDKARAAGLTAIASRKVAAPSYEEASLVLECRKTYAGELQKEGFLQEALCKEFYPEGDLHKVYFGEILHIEGTPEFRVK